MYRVPVKLVSYLIKLVYYKQAKRKIIFMYYDLRLNKCMYF